MCLINLRTATIEVIIIFEKMRKSKIRLNFSNLCKIIVFSLTALSILFFLLPSPIKSAVWDAPEKPASNGILKPNQKLLKAEYIATDKVNAPEDIALDSRGRIYTGTSDGKIIRITLKANGQETIEIFAEVAGTHPLGLRFDSQENLIVAGGKKGLLSVNPEGKVTSLVTEAEGISIRFADDLDIARDGIIYFSDASTKFNEVDSPYGWPYDLLEAKPYGRLIAYNPKTETTKVLLKDLYFANGVTLSQNEESVLVAESFRYRIKRYWLTGVKANTWDYFAENLPGIPDGIMSDRKGVIWIAMNLPRIESLDWLHRQPFLKNQLAKLPVQIWMGGTLWLEGLADGYGFVAAANQQGNIVRTLQDPTGKLLMLSNAVPEEDYLYLGTLFGNQIGRYKLP